MTTNIQEQIKEKPQWLEALEKQSWQAELIASGLAIYGSLALGPMIDDAVIYASSVLQDRLLDLASIIFFYIYGIYNILVFAFIAHLCLRILWAGLLGLSSVYPDGISLVNESYPEHYLEKIKEEFPNLSEYSLDIDKICSRVFANLCGIVFGFTATVIWIVLILLFSEIILTFFNVDVTKPTVIIVLTVVILFVIYNAIFIIGPKKNSELSKKYSYPIAQKFSKLLFGLFYLPISYITWIQRTNQTSKKQFIYGMVVSVLFGMLIGFKSDETLSHFKTKDFYKMNALPQYADARNYLDQNEDTRIISPIIQSKNIKENHLELFIPKLKREELAKIKICGEWETDAKKRTIEYDKSIGDYNETCATKYYTISINDQAPIAINFQYLKHPLNNEKGIITYIPIDSLSAGNHLLKIKTGYEYEGKFAERVIPFYKSKS